MPLSIIWGESGSCRGHCQALRWSVPAWVLPAPQGASVARAEGKGRARAKGDREIRATGAGRALPPL